MTFQIKHRDSTGGGEWMGGECCCKTPGNTRHETHGPRNSHPSQKCCCGTMTYHSLREVTCKNCGRFCSSEFCSRACDVVYFNSYRLNGHAAYACPKRVDCTTIGDGRMDRYAHGDCHMPKMPPADETTFKWITGNIEWTITGHVNSVSTDYGFEFGEINLRIQGDITQKHLHKCNCKHCTREYE